MGATSLEAKENTTCGDRSVTTSGTNFKISGRGKGNRRREDRLLETIDDYIGEENPVRFLEVFVGSWV
jgi:hypothetical protein